MRKLSQDKRSQAFAGIDWETMWKMVVMVYVKSVPYFAYFGKPTEHC